ncbi:hypothetical protein ZOSMA_23G00960 [Zostera marina]|uniref:Uncharacterized protein n=1 Tax=Zostera marina TaxID=29655 RepID=A0A0K9PHI7_ZOSMR|nr:hypothetical protein ZOSMA_23G00960 [Zostera marina]
MLSLRTSGKCLIQVRTDRISVRWKHQHNNLSDVLFKILIREELTS